MHKLLVPIDFSATSAAALRYGSWLADTLNFRLEVVHVYDGFGTPDSLVEYRAGNVSVQERVQRRVNAFVREHTATLATTGGRAGVEAPLIETFTLIGAPGASIVKLSENQAVRLIVMGGVGAGEPRNQAPYYGSVARAVSLRCACPVLLIPKGYGTPTTQTVAIAFAEVGPLRAVAAGTEFLRRALRPSVRFVHVQSSDVLREENMEVDLKKYPISVDRLAPDDVSDALSEYVLAKDVDLLVVGRRKTTRWLRFFLVTELGFLLTRCPVPLLVIPIKYNIK